MPLFLVAFCSTFVFSGLEATFPLFIADRWDYGAREMGQMFVIMGAIVALLQGSVLGRLINRCGEFRLVILGLLINALGMALLPWSAAFVTLTIYLTIAGIGNQIVRPTTSSWISKETSIGQGTAIGMMDAYLSLGTRFRSAIRRAVIYSRHLSGALLDFGGDVDTCVGVPVFPFETDGTLQAVLAKGWWAMPTLQEQGKDAAYSKAGKS